jgi:tetratricopeptide (TPR) repeat protein
MTKMRTLVPVAICAVVAVAAYVRRPLTGQAMAAIPPAAGSPGGAPTTADGLARTIAALERRVAADPGDGVAAARLADALLRQARAASNPGLAIQAEQALRAALAAGPSYEAQRMLGAVLASQHRFREAIAAAEQARRAEPADAWNDGVIGDAQLELGDYDAAFTAFDAMIRKRPSAAAYARAAYARELQGDLDGALRLMQMALDATSAHDPESQAWHRAQLGNLHYQRGRVGEAEREYRHALFTFPDHPLARAGLARVDAARGDLEAALAGYRALAAAGALPEHAARMAELEQALGRHAAAARLFRLAEQGWRTDSPEPAQLALLIARDAGRAAEALAIAEQAAAARKDIATMDAVAWAAFRAGQLDRAVDASRGALRTGSRDRAILYHAAAIAAATGDRARARDLVARALDGHPAFDVALAPEARALQASLASRQARDTSASDR